MVNLIQLGIHRKKTIKGRITIIHNYCTVDMYATRDYFETNISQEDNARGEKYCKFARAHPPP